jgi:hypothetical protein
MSPPLITCSSTFHLFLPDFCPQGKNLEEINCLRTLLPQANLADKASTA